MDFYEVVFKRSIRKFKEMPVPEDVLFRVLEAGRREPSAGNTQPWHFIIVTDAEVKRE